MYWLLKSEPSTWSFDEQEQHKTTVWDGVRNHQAAKFMRQMHAGDLCFFYHSNIGKEIVGIVKVIRSFYPDPSDESGKFVAVDVEFYKRLPKAVTLQAIKANSKLSELLLIKQSRLSVMPIKEHEWHTILDMSKT